MIFLLFFVVFRKSHLKERKFRKNTWEKFVIIRGFLRNYGKFEKMIGDFPKNSRRKMPFFGFIDRFPRNPEKIVGLFVKNGKEFH